MGIALALLCVQDVDAWIRDLGSEDASRRDVAVERLIEAGAAAEPALRKATESRDPDVAARAKTALARIDLNRRAAGIVERVPPELLEKAPETLERLADGDEESLLKLVADFRGIAAPEAEDDWVEMVGAAYEEIESMLMAPVFQIIFEKMEAARAAGTPMRRLETVYASALYWYSGEPGSAGGGSDTVIRAVSSERLLAFYFDGGVKPDDLLDYLQEDPPFGEAPRVRSLLDREDDYWREMGIELVAAIGDRASIPRLRELLSDRPEDAARALAVLADTESIPAILDLYEAAGEGDKPSFAAALLDLEAVEHAESFAGHVGAGGGNWAFHGLTEQRPSTLTPALIEWASGDEARELGHDAMVMLAQARTEEADELLAKCLDSENPSRRQDAWWAMAAAGRGDALAGRLDDDTPTYALRYAIECGLEGSEARLLKAVAEGDGQAMWVARDLRLAAAAPALVKSFETGEDVEALRVLATLPTDHFDRGAAGWPASVVVQAAADAGLALPDEMVRPLLADEDPAVRFAAARLLSDVATVRAVRDDVDGADVWLAAHGDEADVARATEAAGGDFYRSDLIGALAERRAPGAARLLMRSMTYHEAVPFHLNALAQPEAWDRLRNTNTPEGAPAWPTLEALAAWLTDRGIAVTIDERVRESFRREHVSTRAGTVLELLEGLHSTCTNVRLLDDGTIRIETGVTARAAWLDWWAGQKP